MNTKFENQTIALKIGKAEALVLFDLLNDFRAQPGLNVRDNADRLSLVRLHGALESTLVEPFSKEYDQILLDARTHLIRQWGELT